MKSIYFFLCLLMVSIAGCKEDEPTSGLWDPNATVNIRPVIEHNAQTAHFLKAFKQVAHLSALEIVKQTEGMYFQYEGITYDRGFHALQRDTVQPCLKMYGTDIIDQEGNYHAPFIEGVDCVLIRLFYVGTPREYRDTIAYIPNAVLRAAETRIKAAYAIQDYASCYQVFDSAFVFIPITGQEWQYLKAAHIQ